MLTSALISKTDAGAPARPAESAGGDLRVPQSRWRERAAALSALGIGCARMGSIRNHTPVSEIRRTLAAALDHGVNVIDTAGIYAQGDSERIIGEAIAERRDQAFVITKIGFSHGSHSRLVTRLKPVLRLVSRYSRAFDAKLDRARDAVQSQNFSPGYLMDALDGSLRRLGLNEVDGLLLHSPSGQVLEDDRVAEFLARAKRQGKVKHFGASVETLPEARAALDMEGLELLQVDIDTARDLASGPACKIIGQRRIAVFARQVLRPPGLAPDAAAPAIGEALPAALAVPNVRCAIVGLSSRKHLLAAIKAIS
ncbi:MAG TPA: aldo/keto reductase [Rhizobiales bacterium]|nr:aldo/keto reductase [Hyphomicrobiales bacterium]